jgi:hypothetical protein
LIEALGDTWGSDKIEIHEEAQPLYGYQGDQRTEKAHIIIRRKHIGIASNDIGFVKEADGTYTAIISEYDRGRYDDKWMGTVKQKYAVAKMKKEYKRKGLVVKEERNADGRIRLEVMGFR